MLAIGIGVCLGQPGMGDHQGQLQIPQGNFHRDDAGRSAMHDHVPIGIQLRVAHELELLPLINNTNYRVSFCQGLANLGSTPHAKDSARSQCTCQMHLVHGNEEIGMFPDQLLLWKELAIRCQELLDGMRS